MTVVVVVIIMETVHCDKRPEAKYTSVLTTNYCTIIHTVQPYMHEIPHHGVYAAVNFTSLALSKQLHKKKNIINFKCKHLLNAKEIKTIY